METEEEWMKDGRREKWGEGTGGEAGEETEIGI